MGLYALDEQYDLQTWYDYNGAYDLWVGTDLLLNTTRQILASDSYVFQAISFPKGDDVEIDFQQSFSGSVNLVPYSYILGINGFSQNLDQYTLRIYDKGSQTDLYYGQFAWYPTVIGTMQKQFSAVGDFINTQTLNIPFGPYFFRDPLIALPPGDLQIQISNATQTFDPALPIQRVQLMLMVAAPKNTITMQNRKVQHSSDPSGLQSIGALTNLI